MRDFDGPASQNMRETVGTLARLAHSVIADVTEARSIAGEIEQIVPQVRVPVQFIFHPSSGVGEKPYAMVRDFAEEDYWWASPVRTYADLPDLVRLLDAEILPRLEAKAMRLRRGATPRPPEGQGGRRDGIGRKVTMTTILAPVSSPVPVTISDDLAAGTRAYLDAAVIGGPPEGELHLPRGPRSAPVAHGPRSGRIPSRRDAHTGAIPPADRALRRGRGPVPSGDAGRGGACRTGRPWRSGCPCVPLLPRDT